jgi:hypothetical protein
MEIMKQCDWLLSNSGSVSAMTVAEAFITTSKAVKKGGVSN